jgi:hypothetical protein
MWVAPIADGSASVSRAVVPATGVTDPRLGVPSLDALVGAEVFSGAADGDRHRVTSGLDAAGNPAGRVGRLRPPRASSVALLLCGAVATSTVQRPGEVESHHPPGRCQHPGHGRLSGRVAGRRGHEDGDETAIVDGDWRTGSGAASLPRSAGLRLDTWC